MVVLLVSMKVALSSNKAVILVFLHFSIREFLYKIFLPLIFDSVFRSVTPFPDSRFQVLGLPSSPLKCALEYTAKFFFGEAATMSLLQKKSDKNVLYMLSKKLQVTYKGQNCVKHVRLWSL